MKNKSKGLLKIIIAICIIFICVCAIFFIKDLFKENGDTKLNYSTEEKEVTIMLEGQEESITTKKYVSDLGYSMRYDIDRFEVSKNKNQDVYKFIYNDEVIVFVEKSSLPKNCEKASLKNDYNNCHKYIDETKEEYYIYDGDKVYKVLIKTPGGTEYSEGVKVRINYMINTFKIN